MTRKLLILDLDETLIYGTQTPLDHACDFQLEPYHIYKRPGLETFLAQVAQWYELAVWSSASGPYVHGVTTQLFPSRGMLQFVWSNERCTERYDEERREHYWIKNLRKIKQLGFKLEHVLMLEDSPEKIELQYGNVLPVQPFIGQVDDAELALLIPFLRRLSTVENVRSIEKRNWRQH